MRRPFLWGLGAFGQAGVERVIEILPGELKLVMGNCGTRTLSTFFSSAACLIRYADQTQRTQRTQRETNWSCLGVLRVLCVDSAPLHRIESRSPSRRGPVAAVGFPWPCPPFPAACPFRGTIAAPSPPLTDPSVRD